MHEPIRCIEVQCADVPGFDELMQALALEGAWSTISRNSAATAPSYVGGKPWLPTIYNDASYPDLMVVWDHGAGPHSPYGYANEAAWRDNHCVPPEIWDHVANIIETLSLTDEYVLVWLRGSERHG